MPKILTGNRVALTLTVAALLALPAQQADAGGRWIARRGAWSRTTVTRTPGVGRTATYTGGGGRTYSAASTHYNDGGGNFGRTTTLTGPGGKTATRTFNRSASNGTITDTRSATGFNGATRSETVTRTPGVGRTATYTGRAGQTYSAASTHYNDGGGNFGRTTTLTGLGGKTATRTFNRSASNGTITDTLSATGFNGATRSETVTRTPGQGRTVTYTGRNGGIHTSSTSQQAAPQGEQ
jgi:hypothetical protein